MGLKVKISPLFILFSFVVIFYGHFSLFCTYITILLIHEFSHYFMAQSKGYLSQTITIMPYGLVMNEKNTYNKKDEILIYFAGPFVNLILATIFIAVWWYLPSTYYYTYDFVFANLVLGAYNLIPIYPLDGGRILLAMTPISKRKYVKNGMKIFAVLLSLFFVVFFVCSLFSSPSIYYAVVAIFLMSTIIDKNEYSFPMFSDKKLPREVRTFIVKKDTDIHSLLKLIKGDYYYQFLIMDSDKKLLKKITQDELLDMCTKK